MKKTLLLLSTLCLAACANTNSGSPATTTNTSTAEQTVQPTQTVDPAVEAYKAALPAVTADANADFPQLSPDVAEDQAEVKIVTTKGEMTFKLFPKYAPLAVQNFLTQAKEGQYNDITLGSAGDNFIVQSAYSKKVSSIWKDVDPSIDPGTGFAKELSPNLYNLRGAIGMAETTSSFYINTNPTDMSTSIATGTVNSRIVEAYQSGGNPGLDGYYPVFGQLTSGFEVLDAIAAATSPNAQPAETVTILSIEVLKDYTF